MFVNWPAGDASWGTAGRSRRPFGAHPVRGAGPDDPLALMTLWLAVDPTRRVGNEIGVIGDSGAGHSLGNLRCRPCDPGRDVWPDPPASANPPGQTRGGRNPPLRVASSARLQRSVFRRGELRLLLIAGVVAVANAAVIVWIAERHAPHANVHTRPRGCRITSCSIGANQSQARRANTESYGTGVPAAYGLRASRRLPPVLSVTSSPRRGDPPPPWPD